MRSDPDRTTACVPAPRRRGCGAHLRSARRWRLSSPRWRLRACRSRLPHPALRAEPAAQPALRREPVVRQVRLVAQLPRASPAGRHSRHAPRPVQAQQGRRQPPADVQQQRAAEHSPAVVRAAAAVRVPAAVLRAAPAPALRLARAWRQGPRQVAPRWAAPRPVVVLWPVLPPPVLRSWLRARALWVPRLMDVLHAPCVPVACGLRPATLRSPAVARFSLLQPARVRARAARPAKERALPSQPQVAPPRGRVRTHVIARSQRGRLTAVRTVSQRTQLARAMLPRSAPWRWPAWPARPRVGPASRP